MKTLRIVVLLGWGCLTALSLQAQKKVPYQFHYQVDEVAKDELKPVTTISHGNASSIRLYFSDVQLGTTSYLILEGKDGKQQLLDAEALANWNNSSAYFNGDWIKVSVHQKTGESIAFSINSLKVTEGNGDQASQARKITSVNKASQQTNGAEVPLPAYAKAVGRFTNGIDAKGTGWIAANGAIVTSHHYVMEHYDLSSFNDDYSPEVYDVIEFNMPPSNADKSINHSAPEDQYPINTNYVFGRIIAGNQNNDFGPDFIEMELPKYYISVHGGYSIVEVLPNGTGKRPGERIQEYFQVTRHPSGNTMEDRTLNVLHNGEPVDNDPTGYYTVNLTEVLAMDPGKNLRSVSDKDRFLVYKHFMHLSSKNNHYYAALGAPVTYDDSNVAVGIHSYEANLLGFGTGFRDDDFRRHLGEFFSDKTTYVDPNSYWDTENGTIDKPYFTIASAAQHVAENGILSIVRGSYNESVTLNTPMTIKVPVGAVIIGTSEGSNSRKARPSLLAELFVDDEESVFEEEEVLQATSVQSFPNPFVDRTELYYTLTDNSPVLVKVYDMLGQEVHTLVQEEQSEGEHSVQWDGRNEQGKMMPAGLYIMQLRTGEKTSAVRVMKQ